jgi:hypothetical protein
VTKSATNRYQSISINLSIVIENRYQSITTRIFAIDWSSIININRLIDIDWYRLISIVIDYRFHRLDTPGHFQQQDNFDDNSRWNVQVCQGARRQRRRNSKIYIFKSTAYLRLLTLPVNEKDAGPLHSGEVGTLHIFAGHEIVPDTVATAPT